jgi:carbon storage regulator CsrA
VLILSRKIGERILVPAYGLAITVTAINGKAVRLAVSAPPEIDICRAELRGRGAFRCDDPEEPTTKPRALGR